MALSSFVNVSFDDQTYKLKYVHTLCGQVYVDILDAGEVLTGNRKNCIAHIKRYFPDMDKDLLQNLSAELGKVHPRIPP